MLLNCIFIEILIFCPFALLNADVKYIYSDLFDTFLFGFLSLPA